MARDVLVNLGLVDICRSQAFGDLLASEVFIFSLALFTPPVRVDDPVDRVRARSLVALGVVSVRVLKLVALLGRAPGCRLPRHHETLN